MTPRFGIARLRLLAAAAGIVALIGCGAEERAAKDATPAATKAPSVAVPDELVGIWTRRIPSPKTSKWVEPGVMSIRVHRDGNVDQYEADTNPAHDCLTEYYCSTFVVSARDGKLIIRDTPGCGDPATYSYKITGSRLTTKKVEDGCSSEIRPFVFHGATWRRQP